MLTALLFAFIAGLLLFFFLMRKLRVLSLAMQEFKDSNLSQTETISSSASKPQDEIETMASTFQEMALRITFANASLAGDGVITPRTGG